MRMFIGGCVFIVAISTFAENVSTNALQQLREQQIQEDSELAKYAAEKQADIQRLEDEIRALMPEVEKPVPPDSSLPQITEIGRQRALAAESVRKLRGQIDALQDEVTKTHKRANVSKHFRSTEIAAENGDPIALRKREFDKAYSQYKEVCEMVDKGHLDASHQKAAWNALCMQFKMDGAKNEPGTLVWNPADGKVQSASDLNWSSPSTGMQFVWVDKVQMWVGKFEVTNQEYRKKVPEHDSGEHKGHTLNADRQPVVMINANEALEYSEWLTDCDQYKLPAGYHYRLPTPEEWTTIDEFQTVNDRPTRVAPVQASNTVLCQVPLPPPPIKPIAPNGNYKDASWLKMMINAGDSTSKDLAHSHNLMQFDDGHAVSASVDESYINSIGLYGFGGNVWEFCLRGIQNVDFKGSAWDSDPDRFLMPRWEDSMLQREPNIGFRLVVAISPKADTPVIPVKALSYAERRRQRIKEMSKRAQESRNRSAEDKERRLGEYQMKLIREGKTPLPIPMTEEMDEPLQKEGLLLPPVKEQDVQVVEEGLPPPLE